jgi:hypothetical protein
MTTTMPTIPTWYLPSYFGDIRLDAQTDTSCVVITTELTPKEKAAIGKLEVMAKKKGWRDTSITLSGSSVLRAPIEKVAKTLSKLLKPDRTIISAVKFSDGTMEEIREATTSPAGAADKTPVVQDQVLAKPETTPKAKVPKTATSVAAPVRGCPPPEFSQAEIRAQRVLAAFISTEQIADFKKYQRFVSIGQTTGHRYMVTSRHAKDQLATYTRSLYDMDLQSPICAHDYDVPPAEELLGFHVLLQLPGWEDYLNKVTEANHHLLLNGLLPLQ